MSATSRTDKADREWRAAPPAADAAEGEEVDPGDNAEEPEAAARDLSKKGEEKADACVSGAEQ